MNLSERQTMQRIADLVPERAWDGRRDAKREYPPVDEMVAVDRACVRTEAHEDGQAAYWAGYALTREHDEARS